MKRIVTDVNTDLGTLIDSELSEESIKQNELLIKELLLLIKTDEKYVSRADLEIIEKYKATQLLINELCVELEVSSLSQIGECVAKMQMDLENTINKLDKSNIALDKKNLLVHKLKAENKKLKKSLSNCKNRKVVRIVDKLAGK